MTNVFPTSNLPTVSQPWGREVQKRVEILESQFSLQKTNSATIDAQLQASYRRLDETVIGLLQADLDIQAALAQANISLNAVVSLGTSGSTYNINADNITAGTINASTVAVTNINASNITSGTINASTVAVTNINASNITAGTLTGITVRTGLSGRRVEITGTSSFYYNDSGSYAGQITASGGSTIVMQSTSGAFMAVFSGGAQIYGDGNNSITLTNNEIDFGTSQMVGTVPASWQTREGAWFGRGAFVVSNMGANAASFSRSNAGDVVIFYRGSTTSVGSISVTASATAYNTSSDYRLKENVTPITGALDRLMHLKPSRFNFKIEPDKIVDGFIAHEVQEVIPEAIKGTKDEVDKDGNPIYQGIDQSKLVPLAIAAIQELADRIQTLENGAING